MGNMRWQDEGQEGEADGQFGEQDPNDQQDQELGDPSFQEEYLQQDFGSQDEQALAVMDEAVLRIEQANLYQTLINHNLFANGSARPEIIQKVQAEVRTFILSRLKVLLGIEQERSQEPVQVELPFDDDQVDFLRALADRGLRRTGPLPQASQPVLNPVQATPQAPAPQPAPVRAPAINPVPAPQQTAAQAPQRARPQQRRAQAPQQQGSQAPNGQKIPPRQAKASPKRRRSANTSGIDGKDLSQAINPANPPKPAPPQAIIDQMHAQQVANLTAPSPAGSANMASIAAKLLTGK